MEVEKSIMTRLEARGGSFSLKNIKTKNLSIKTGPWNSPVEG